MTILTEPMVVRAMGVLGATFKKLDALPALSILDVQWKPLRRLMGHAHFKSDAFFKTRKATITFSSALWPHAPSDKDRDETVIHEVCHIVDYWNMSIDPRYPKDGGHKEPWKVLMRKCGLDPKRCYEWKRPQELKNKPRERYELVCRHCSHVHRPTIIVVRRLISGESRYFCKKCMQNFHPTDIKTP